MNTHSSGTVYNLIILDESFSMEMVREPTVQGFNELVQSVQELAREFPQRKQMVSLTTFNGVGVQEKLFLQDATTLQPLTLADYCPTSMTPLHDAMGQSLNKLRQVLATTKAADYQVLVTVLTDGEENASKQYNLPMIHDLVEQLKQQGWTFAYIGTNHDVNKAAEGLAIDNTLCFSQNAVQMGAMFEKERYARRRYNLKPIVEVCSGKPKADYFSEAELLPSTSSPDVPQY